LVKLLLADPRESACLKLAEYLQPFKIAVSDESDLRIQDIAAEILEKARSSKTPTPGRAGHGWARKPCHHLYVGGPQRRELRT
jgi:hypothetical protein